jgi:hypothetical protein
VSLVHDLRAIESVGTLIGAANDAVRGMVNKLAEQLESAHFKLYVIKQ